MQSLVATLDFPADTFDMAVPTVATLAERVDNHIKFFWIVVGAGFLWLGALSLLLYHINDTANRIATNQASMEVKQNLTEITARVASLQVQGNTQRVTKELDAASKTVSLAIAAHPQYSETWRAASSLVNLRSLSSTASDIPSDVAAKTGPPIPNQGNCFTMPLPASTVGQITPSNSVWVVSGPWWHDCTLYLDDVEGFEHSTFKRYIYDKVGPAHDVLVAYDLTLVRVIVVYHGGEIIPVSHVIFYDCRFDFYVPTTPFGRGKDLLAAMLSQSFEERNLNITVPLPKPATQS